MGKVFTFLIFKFQIIWCCVFNLFCPLISTVLNRCRSRGRGGGEVHGCVNPSLHWYPLFKHIFLTNICMIICICSPTLLKKILNPYMWIFNFCAGVSLNIHSFHIICGIFLLYILKTLVKQNSQSIYVEDSYHIFSRHW